MSSLREKYRDKKPIGKKRRLKRIKKVKVYKKEKCCFIYENGLRCRSWAIGSGQLCKKHGGEKDIKNTLSIVDTELYLQTFSPKYKPGVHSMQFIQLSKEGKSDVEVAAEMEISIGTLKNWGSLFEEFAMAMEIGYTLYEAYWLAKGEKGITTRGFNASLYKFITGNKLGYSEKVESKNVNMNVHGVLVAPSPKTVEEWEGGEGGEGGEL